MSNIDWTQQDASLNINQTSKHLIELKREIELEEEEIFANINELISGNSDLSFDEENSTSDALYTKFTEYEAKNNTTTNNNIQTSQLYPCIARSYSPSAKFSPTFEEEEEEEEEEDEDEENEKNRYPTFVDSLLSGSEDPKYDDNVDKIDDTSLKTKDDEQDVENGEINYDIDDDLQAAIQEVTNNLPKPCVFFLEGNCRRSDCKFSHDLSNITCKYWIEGFCFKGDMCPFLHSFNVPGDQQDSMALNDDIIEDSNKNLEPNFTIESEADFPSLPLDAPTNIGERLRKQSNKIEANLKDQILKSNPSVIFKALKRKRKRG